MEDQHGLLAREFPEIEKVHESLAFSASPFLLSVHGGEKIINRAASINLLTCQGRFFKAKSEGKKAMDCVPAI
jgi:hypothetical protein